MNDYPTEIDFDNQFTVRSIDLDTFDFPKLRVVAWSSLFEEGGSYAVEPVKESTSDHTLHLTRVRVKTNDRSIRQNLADLVEAWNEDPRANWLRILRKSASEVAVYSRKKVDEFDEVVAAAEKADKFLARVNELSEVTA